MTLSESVEGFNLLLCVILCHWYIMNHHRPDAIRAAENLMPSVVSYHHGMILWIQRLATVEHCDSVQHHSSQMVKYAARMSILRSRVWKFAKFDQWSVGLDGASIYSSSVFWDNWTPSKTTSWTGWYIGWRNLQSNLASWRRVLISLWNGTGDMPWQSVIANHYSVIRSSDRISWC